MLAHLPAEGWRERYSELGSDRGVGVILSVQRATQEEMEDDRSIHGQLSGIKG